MQLVAKAWNKHHKKDTGLDQSTQLKESRDFFKPLRLVDGFIGLCPWSWPIIKITHPSVVLRLLLR